MTDSAKQVMRAAIALLRMLVSMVATALRATCPTCMSASIDKNISEEDVDSLKRDRKHVERFELWFAADKPEALCPENHFKFS